MPAALQPGVTRWPDRGAIAAIACAGGNSASTPSSRPAPTWRAARGAGGAARLSRRAAGNTGGISSPLKAPTACSRLSPYLAWGCLSLRELVQATCARVAALPEGDRRRAGLAAFLSRLYWHCHFIQKLESEPTLEFRNLHRGYDGLREPEWNQAHFDALVGGRTGWPLVDACVAMLRATGWLNFRMRAMLVSVAAYLPGCTGARSGMAGARLPRLRARHPLEPDADAVRHHRHQHHPVVQPDQAGARPMTRRACSWRWLPALRRVPDAWLFEPLAHAGVGTGARGGVRVGEDIALPVVDLSRHARRQDAHPRTARPARGARGEGGYRRAPRLAQAAAGRARRRRAAPGQLDLGF